MSFWDLSDGETVKAETEYEAPQGGDMSPMPDNTDVMVYCDEAKWDEKEGNEYVSLRWRVAKPEAYKNRVVFQKLWVIGNNPQQSDADKRKKQGDNAKRMLAAIDANTGGGLLALEGRPKDEDLQSNLMNKMIIAKLKVWEMTGSDGKPMSGNWICAVSPKTKGVSEDVKPVENKAAATVDDDTDIPF